MNVLFIWIPKNAGNSIYSLLKCPKLKSIESAKQFKNKGIVTFGHMNYLELLKQGFIDRVFHLSSFKFCFARNPYDRFVSLYYYLRKRKAYKDITPEDFCYLISKGVPKIGLYNSRKLSQCSPQIDWIRNIKLNFIGKTENINKDLFILFEKIGLKFVGVVPVINATVHVHYKKFYKDHNAVKKFVEDLYKEDFDFFGYERCLRVNNL